MRRPHRLCGVLVLFLLPSAGLLCAQDAKPMFHAASGYVSASGKWKSSSGRAADEPAFKHVVEIQCRLDINECYEATAQIVAEEPQVILQSYSVIKWDTDGIIAENSSPICTINRLLINFEEGGVLAVDSPKNDAKGMPLGSGKDTCQLVAQTRSYKLVSSWK